MFKYILSLTCLLIALLLGAGYGLYQSKAVKVENQAFADLADIVNTKSSVVAHWIKQRNGDARVWGSSRIIARECETFIRAPDDPKLKSSMQAHLDVMLRAHGYKSAMIVSAKANILLSTDLQAGMDYPVPDVFKKAMTSGQIQHTDFYIHPSQDVFMAWVVPIFPASSNAQGPIAAFVLRINESLTLLPFIKSSHGRYKTFETVLMTFDKEKAICLTLAGNASSNVAKRDLSHPDSLGFKLKHATSVSGTGKSLDPSKKEVLFAYRAIEDTPWLMIAKIDRREILFPVARMVWSGGFVVFVTISMICIALFQNLYQQKKNPENGD